MTVRQSKAAGKARMSKLDILQRKELAALGGRASAAKLTATERSEKARKAAQARWRNR